MNRVIIPNINCLLLPVHIYGFLRYDRQSQTDYSHPLSDTLSALCENGLMLTGMQEFDYDISDTFEALDHLGFPLSMILELRKRSCGPL